MDRPATEPILEVRLAGQVGRAWGLLGVLVLLGQAIYRLGALALAALRSPLGPWQWAVLAAWTAAMVYGEGVRGFQRGFSPRVVARAWYLARHPHPVHVPLAPLYAMGLVHATRKRLVTSWALTTTMIGLVILMRFVSQPLRGIIDAGVVAGLIWGAVAILVFALRGALGRPPGVALDLPSARA